MPPAVHLLPGDVAGNCSVLAPVPEPWAAGAVPLCPGRGDRPGYGAVRAVRAGPARTPDVGHVEPASHRDWPTGSQRPFPRTLDRDTDRTRPTPRGEAGSRSQRLSFRLLNSSVWKCGFSTGACALYTRVSVCAHVRYTHTEVYTHASCTHTRMECTCTVPCHVHARCTPCPCTCSPAVHTQYTQSHTCSHVYAQGCVFAFTHRHRSACTLAGCTQKRVRTRGSHAHVWFPSPFVSQCRAKHGQRYFSL